MRRGEFNVTDMSELEKLLNEASCGTLCLNDNPYPYAVPVNFIYIKNALYFHGSVSGRKYELSLKNQSGSFGVFEEYSFLPSYFNDPDTACYATQFFASAFLEGKISLINTMEEKAPILEALMRKYQGDRKHLNIEENLEKYASTLGKTAVFCFEILSWSLKIKAGQNMTKNQFYKVARKLLDRGDNIDTKSVELMRKYHDTKSSQK